MTINFNLKIYVVAVSTILLFSLQSSAQSQLTIEEIMQGKDFTGHWPTNPRWSEDGKTVYFDWNPDNNPSDSLYKYVLGKDAPEKVNPNERRNLPSSGGEYNSDHSLKVYSKDGEIYLLNIKTGKISQLTKTSTREHSPYFHGENIHFTADNNLFERSADGAIKQLTDFKNKKAPKEKKPSVQEEWLEEDQLLLSEVLKKRHEEKEMAKEIREANEPEQPKIIYIDDKRVSNIEMSPKGDYISYTLYTRAKDKDTMVPEFVTVSGFTEPITTRPKVGADLASREVWLYNLSMDSVYKVHQDDFEGIKDQPDFYEEYPELQEKEPEIREVYSYGPFWSEDGNHAVMVHRSTDNKDRWITLLNPVSGQNTDLVRQRDEAWIGGPGMGWGLYSAGEIGWMPDNESVWFQSEETGYSHLYTVNVNSKEKKALTSGEFEIYNPKQSRDKKNWYFSSNEGDAGQRHFYRMPINGGKRTRITTKEGHHDVALSPDEKKIADFYSYANKPWEFYLMDNKPGASMRQITNSTNEDFEAYNWRVPEFITFEARDGASVPARLYKPENPKPDAPAVIFVHGAGYLQNAHKWWSSYFREYMFHNFLVDNGYTVLDIDYRASAGYGRDWRTAIYRHMGGWDLNDNVDGAKYLINEHNIGEDKVGIYGGSYGGFITLMALFTEPDVFAAGAALRSVTDWAHYNHGYTSNILNTPALDPKAYKRSSPIYFAENLQKPLLIAHGMIDTNVHFQDVVRLSQRLIELGKEDWEMAIYPVEDHSFVEPSSWTDEYTRIYKLFEENLKTEINK
ncbi:MAG: prolyl oligopeptidase family serine peptidase [Candidatus Cyclobacteriaceae bacterium M2_1C_046]